MDFLYITCRYELSQEELERNAERLVKELRKRKANSIALIANAQYNQLLPELKKILFREGITSHIGSGTSRIAGEGQGLGCN